jgi:hypothetical protein
MRVFVYEHVCATGVGRDSGSPEHSLFVEGRAMLTAVSADFQAVPGVEVVTFPDGGDFARLSASADWTLVIAPETGGELERLARLVLASGGRLLGPSPDAVAITSDKIRLAHLWDEDGVPTPRTFAADGPIEFPLVYKPRHGCGSEGVTVVANAWEMATLPPDSERLIQQYVPGQPASVSFLIGPSQTVPLHPTFQLLSSDGQFRYLGGTLPIMPQYAERAVKLGRQAIACVPGLFGYVGVDLVLGERDVAIEINPRLTTSYVGLRAAAETNLAGAMLDVCEGRPVELKWKPGTVNFAADGTIW